jgi:hypothetical protein
LWRPHSALERDRPCDVKQPACGLWKSSGKVGTQIGTGRIETDRYQLRWRALAGALAAFASSESPSMPIIRLSDSQLKRFMPTAARLAVEKRDPFPQRLASTLRMSGVRSQATVAVATSREDQRSPRSGREIRRLR